MRLTSDVTVGYMASGPYGDYEVIEYRNCKNVKVRFSVTGYEVWTTNSQVTRGQVKDKLARTVYGVGYIGHGAGSVSGDRKAYIVWRSMIFRCYSGKCKTYLDCSVCEEWHNFQNFLCWFNEKYIEGFELDKDIKVNGNRVYSPDTCLFVSKADNLAEKSKPVKLMHVITGEILEFKSVSEASKYTGISAATVSRICNMNHKSGISGSWLSVNKMDMYL